ncbi:MAG: NCS2 family permease [Fibromonadaceae bacterium]|jgi:AGZA family xanthine/uracil permease-like MFS transporter|nr:NCS2 family permease [Fibromonadaceae bacterium]
MNFLEDYFGIAKSGSTLYKELVAGITTFFAMSYILFVNPMILSETGMDKSAQFTATALAAIFGTLVMGVYARLPFALAPGMGLNTFFAYTMCLFLGHSWHFALGVVFVEGVIFFLLSIFDLRRIVVNLIPRSLQLAFCPGIGLFIASVGLQQAKIIEMHENSIKFGQITDPNVLLACLGILVIGVFYVKKIYVGMVVGIIVLTIISLSFGLTQIESFFSLPPSVSDIMFAFNFSEILSYDFICLVLLLLSVDIFDTMGTLLGVSNATENLANKDGSPKNIRKAFVADSLATVFGAMVGTNTTTTYIESSTGVSVGGRTGITSIVTALCFVIALFSFPMLLAVPPAAVSAMLIFAGYNMFMSPALKNMDFKDYSESVPAFITMIVMPFSHSIVDGISFGVLSYVLINSASRNLQKISTGTYLIAIFFAARYVILPN